MLYSPHSPNVSFLHQKPLKIKYLLEIEFPLRLKFALVYGDTALFAWEQFASSSIAHAVVNRKITMTNYPLLILAAATGRNGTAQSAQ
jgi:hypothetical protein